MSLHLAVSSGLIAHLLSAVNVFDLFIFSVCISVFSSLSIESISYLLLLLHLLLSFPLPRLPLTVPLAPPLPRPAPCHRFPRLTVLLLQPLPSLLPTPLPQPILLPQPPLHLHLGRPHTPTRTLTHTPCPLPLWKHRLSPGRARYRSSQ